MNTKDTIGRTITDILVWSKMEVGGLDEAKVFIQLDNGKIIAIPWGFESMDLEREPHKNAKSLFSDLSDIPSYYINPEKKTIGEVLAAKKKRESSLFGRIKRIIGIEEWIPKEYRVYKTEFRENQLKFLKNKKIIDFLMIKGFDSVGFLELENGNIITERAFASHGTGAAGLEFYESIVDFERDNGNEYLRFTEICR